MWSVGSNCGGPLIGERVPNGDPLDGKSQPATMPVSRARKLLDVRLRKSHDPTAGGTVPATVTFLPVPNHDSFVS